MSKDALVNAVKTIHTQARAGNLDDAYAGYRELFSSAWFGECKPEDQRQALRLMVFAKGVPPKLTEAMTDAFRSALQPLTELVSRHGEPSDYELLGICHVELGNNESADRIFRDGLTIERQRNAGSDLCGAFMKRIAAL
ncbi:hypothetical protein [Chondromyces apiculatus]|uniref:Uncharacterized protein n=1 Tax=Chondromyces apiculatus DSM 436 TaxID=1192034 RepID=A0A017TD81_9BACT|nr:hypothetical protein [Chondromyces apiculatus]EYF07194.1 Hypothetical protein CAP_0673 [Chondromyces apiculatus DSM 436]